MSIIVAALLLAGASPAAAPPRQAGKPEAVLILDFSTYRPAGADHRLSVRYKLMDGTTEELSVEIKGRTKVTAVLAQVDSVLEDMDLRTEAGRVDDLLRVRGTKKSQLAELHFTVKNPPNGWRGPSFDGACPTGKSAPRLFVNGRRVTARE